MNGRAAFAVAIGCGLALAAAAEASSSRHYPRYGRTKSLGQLTVAELRELGLSDEQIQKAAETRRDLLHERKKLEARLETAQAAVRAANTEANQLRSEISRLDSERLDEAIQTLLTAEQRTRWDERRLLEQAKSWLKSYSYSLDLTEAQKEDIALLLVPVLREQETARKRLDDARKTLDQLRHASRIDIQAIDQAEKTLAELQKLDTAQGRYKPLLEAMRAGLLPDQLEKFDKRYRYYLKK